ncbi:hypothetical protein Vadar_002767 [Vaccinium darrowii]|uniref:Uncharacterized protein n=1 Tax=Vaccinium darrowii TaxID=229202 RepID=A0ACB7YT07_9ERIC|nr:hypothetical protein Vadar_002767 [Vaccinium darrowii]
MLVVLHLQCCMTVASDQILDQILAILSSYSSLAGTDGTTSSQISSTTGGGGGGSGFQQQAFVPLGLSLDNGRDDFHGGGFGVKSIREVMQSTSRHRRQKLSAAVKVIKAEDRISNLSKNLISHILSLLPTKYAVRTGILSTKWKWMWTSISNLDFDDETNPYFANQNDDRGQISLLKFDVCPYEIRLNTPNLLYFAYMGLVAEGFAMNKLSSLVEASIDIDLCYEQVENWDEDWDGTSLD